jgi:RecB family exonuclease
VSAYDECPLRWFLDREVHAVQPSTSAQGFGLVLHVMARLVATERLAPDVDELMTRVDEVWRSLAFEAPWQRERERGEARRALQLFLRWHTGRAERTYVASEAGFAVDYAGTHLRGSIDRVERDTDGRVHIVDYKTGRTPPPNNEIESNAQLAVYQVAVREGGLEEALGPDATLGGAELVHLRKGMATGLPKVQGQAPLDAPEGTWADDLIHRVATGIAGEQFPARINEHCDRCVFRRTCPAQDEGKQVVQ